MKRGYYCCVHVSWISWFIVLFVFLVLVSSDSVFAQDSNPQVDQAREDMMRIGTAIESLYHDRGVRLVDLTDGDTPEGRARLQDVFENVGNPSDRPRTMRDVLQPLVFFGYLDSIPEDPFIPEDADPIFDTFVYMDEEKEIAGEEDRLSVSSLDGFFSLVLGLDDWCLVSAGENRSYSSHYMNNLYVTRYEVFVRMPYVEEILEQSKSNMQRIGLAIERLRAEKGVLLVDFWDDDHEIARERIATIFNDVGNVPEGDRNRSDVLMPLVELGYLDSLPADPFVPSTALVGSLGWSEFKVEYDMTYIYCDSDPEISDANYGEWGDNLNFELEEGEWVLLGYLPMEELPSEPFYYQLDTTLFLFSRDLESPVEEWEIY